MLSPHYPKGGNRMVTDQMIYDYYWKTLEPCFNGLIDIKLITEAVNGKFNAVFTTKQVTRVIMSNSLELS